MKFVAAVYSHPDYYPPMLNAIRKLSQVSTSIEIISRNIKNDECNLGDNVKLNKSGKFKSIRDSEKASKVWKIMSFISFTFLLVRTINRVKPDWLVVYDPIPLLASRLILPFIIKKPKIWYHNHDILEIKTLSKYSISWFAYKSEKTFFNNINLFTLPSEERKKYYPIEKSSGKYLFLPNYTPLYKLQNRKENIEELKLIYQGQINNEHGLVELINFIAKNNVNKKISLTIIGFGEEQFKSYLSTVIKEKKLENAIKVLEAVSYEKLWDVTIQHNIGIAINKPINIQYETGSTASNKIYEFLSFGFPVILFDSESYKRTLGTREWAFFTDLSDNSLKNILSNIQEQYIKISNSATSDFKAQLNFDIHFEKVLTHLTCNN